MRSMAGHGDVYYTCSMHPQVMQDKPGNCPICGMKLIEVTKTSTPKKRRGATERTTNTIG